MAAIVTIFDEGRISLRRSNVPGRVPPPSPVELRCWQQVHSQNLPAQATDAAQSIRGWPVHEKSWKREILRTEVELEYAG